MIDKTPHAVTGRVVDMKSEPVKGAIVRVPGRADFATTDANGDFTLADVMPVTTLTAHKEGYWIDMAISEQPFFHLRPLPENDCDTYKWISPTPIDDYKGRYRNCGDCHTKIYDEWKSGGHAYSATRQHFRDLYAGGKSGWNLLKEHPDGAGVCAACHAPTYEPASGTGYDLRAAFRQPSDEITKRRDQELNSVHCDYCHKIVGAAEGEVGLTHGRYGLKLLRPKEGQLLFGPLTDANRSDNAYSPFQKQSRLCASCHEGTIFGVRVYSTYSEWQASPAGKSGVQCQDCHMKPTGKMTNIAPGHDGVERDPKTLANHVFFDGSREEMLKRCLKVNITPARDRNGVRVGVEVIAEGVGHRIPTGFVDRNIVLLIEATDAAGRPVAHLSGPTIPRTATAGRLYAKQLKDFDGRCPVPFWRADPDLIDTRLKPGEPDVSAWRFPAAATTLKVRVRHRRFWPEVAAEKGWTDNETAILEREVKVP